MELIGAKSCTYDVSQVIIFKEDHAIYTVKTAFCEKYIYAKYVLLLLLEILFSSEDDLFSKLCASLKWKLEEHY